jgi:hypothetical protein
MDNDVFDELLRELFSAFETADTQSAAILQFLKEKGMASDEELAPFLEQAGNASSVRWRAVRVRVSSLLSSAAKKMDESVARQAEETAQKAVAAELEAEKPSRRRRKPTAEKQPEAQGDKSKGQQETASSTAERQPAEKNQTERQESAKSKAADTKREPNKPELGETESAKVETGESEQSNSQSEQRDSGQSEKKIA